MSRSLLKGKSAVTPVLSNILLTAIAVAAMSIAASATFLITQNMRDIMSERVVIEDVWFVSSGISVYLRNTGKVGIEISSVYVSYTSQTFTPVNLAVDEHGWLNITYSWDSEVSYHINVVTSRGTKIVNYFKSP